MHPEVEDSGGDDEAVGGFEQRAQPVEQVVPTRIGYPDGGVSELLGLYGGIDRAIPVAESQACIPDAHTTELHLHSIPSTGLMIRGG